MAPAIASLPCSLIPHFLPHSDPPYQLLQDHPSLSLLSRCRSIKTLKQIHSQITKTGLHNTHFALSKLLHFCAVSPFRDLSYALSLFETIEQPNQVLFNTIIRGYALSSSPLFALKLYARMLFSDLVPNSFTFPFLLKSCAKMGRVREGKQVHAHVLKLGLDSHAFVHSSLINMYAQIGELSSAQLVFDTSPLRGVVSYTALITGYASRGFMDEALQLFEEIPVRDVVSWNSIIAGYTRSGQYEMALLLLEKMRRAKVVPNESTMVTALSACAKSGSLELGKWIASWIEEHGLGSNLHIENALIDMYAKCGDLDTALSLFEGLQQRDVISWNVLIGGYAHRNQPKEALSLFQKMLREKIEPSDVTFLNILPVCANLGAYDFGRWIHAYIGKNFKDLDNTSMWTSLINMYVKCGNIEAARQVFSGMKTKSLSSWNAMISGFAMHGQADAALSLFDKMNNEGLKPDEITLVGVLSACSHAGLLDLGRQYFNSMVHDYKISPELHHYGCMIDLLGRAGLFDEAETLMKDMEIEPDGAVWGSLLGACRVHKKVELGESVAEHLFKLEPDNPGAYVLLSNIYAGAGRWHDVARIRTMLNNRGMRKIPGCSSIEVDSVVHEFLVGDNVHPQSKEIYEMLKEIDTVLEKSRFFSDTSEVLYDLDEEWKRL